MVAIAASRAFYVRQTTAEVENTRTGANRRYSPPSLNTGSQMVAHSLLGAGNGLIL